MNKWRWLSLWPFSGLDVWAKPVVPSMQNWRYVMEHIYSNPARRANFERTALRNLDAWQARRGVEVRWRFIGWRGFHLARDCYSQGTVYRVWLGWVLITVMVPA